MNRPCLVLFDMSNDYRRGEVRQLLHLYGHWLQRSLWIIEKSTISTLGEISQSLQDLVEEEDRLYVLRPCLKCLSEIRVLTPATRIQDLA